MLRAHSQHLEHGLQFGLVREQFAQLCQCLGNDRRLQVFNVVPALTDPVGERAGLTGPEPAGQRRNALLQLRLNALPQLRSRCAGGNVNTHTTIVDALRELVDTALARGHRREAKHDRTLCHHVLHAIAVQDFKIFRRVDRLQ